MAAAATGSGLTTMSIATPSGVSRAARILDRAGDRAPGDRDRRGGDQPLDLLARDRAGAPVALGETDQRYQRNRERERVDQVGKRRPRAGGQRAPDACRGPSLRETAPEGGRPEPTEGTRPRPGRGRPRPPPRRSASSRGWRTARRGTRAGTAPRARPAPGSARPTRAPAGAATPGTPPRAPAYSSTPPASTLTANSTPVSASSIPIRFDGRCHRISEPVSPIVSASSPGVTARTARRPDTASSARPPPVVASTTTATAIVQRRAARLVRIA